MILGRASSFNWRGKVEERKEDIFEVPDFDEKMQITSTIVHHHEPRVEGEKWFDDAVVQQSENLRIGAADEK